MKTNKSILIIMDGWGIAEDATVSAVQAAHTPYYDRAISTFPNIRLQASGLAVGLPDGQMGNSEVGHMNIGAGRVVYQMLARINKNLSDGTFKELDKWKEMIGYCKKHHKPLHLLGLLSDGGVHSHLDHLKAILSLLADEELPAGVFVHAFMDGRDTDPQEGIEYVVDLEMAMTKTTGKLASLVGRYYAMDRDKRWSRTKVAYDLLVHGKGTPYAEATMALEASYELKVTDEFVKPIVLMDEGKPVATINEGDGVLVFNFRTDRGRQLTQVLTQEDIPAEGMQTLDLHYTTLTRYDDTYKGINVLFEKEEIANGMGEYLAKNGKRQIRIAETEKYPHVTFFFNGGREQPMEGEEHLLCPSPKVATYDLEPTMSAKDIQDTILPRIAEGDVDFICLNFANPDMVGHTGVFEAAVTACETVDACTQAVAEAAAKAGYKIIITADHGNADRMKNPDGTPHTAHTTVPVPCILIDPEGTFTFKGDDGKLGDLAPTLLTLMGLDVPEEMTGDVLVKKMDE